MQRSRSNSIDYDNGIDSNRGLIAPPEQEKDKVVNDINPETNELRRQLSPSQDQHLNELYENATALQYMIVD